MSTVNTNPLASSDWTTERRAWAEIAFRAREDAAVWAGLQELASPAEIERRYARAVRCEDIAEFDWHRIAKGWNAVLSGAAPCPGRSERAQRDPEHERGERCMLPLHHPGDCRYSLSRWLGDVFLDAGDTDPGVVNRLAQCAAHYEADVAPLLGLLRWLCRASHVDA